MKSNEETFGNMETRAPFNMALNTLERIGEILREIKRYSCTIDLSWNHKQYMKAQLTRQLFIQSSPLLDEEKVEDMKEEFDGIFPNAKKIVQENGGGNYKPIDDYKVTYSPELEVKLDYFILKVQRELQKMKYFMPPREDAGTVGGRF